MFPCGCGGKTLGNLKDSLAHPCRKGSGLLTWSHVQRQRTALSVGGTTFKCQVPESLAALTRTRSTVKFKTYTITLCSLQEDSKVYHFLLETSHMDALRTGHGFILSAFVFIRVCVQKKSWVFPIQIFSFGSAYLCSLSRICLPPFSLICLFIYPSIHPSIVRAW